MEQPPPGIVGIEGDRDRLSGRHQDCIAHSTGYAPPTQPNNLEVMAVQVHRMSHPGAIRHLDRDALALRGAQRHVVCPCPVVERPDIRHHRAG